MINLLPPETRENIMFARRNTQLLHWAISLLVGLAGIVAVVVFGHIYIDSNTKNINKQVEQARAQLKVQKLEETQKRVEDISSTLKLTTQVLSKQVLFSELLQQTGAAMPAGTSLSSLTINKLQGGLELQVDAKNYQTATQVQLNLQDPKNKIFEKVDIINIHCNSGASGSTQSSDYPCTGTYRGLFVKNHPFSFINTPATQGGAQ